jgi:hypothetical protein
MKHRHAARRRDRRQFFDGSGALRTGAAHQRALFVRECAHGTLTSVRRSGISVECSGTSFRVTHRLVGRERRITRTTSRPGWCVEQHASEGGDQTPAGSTCVGPSGSAANMRRRDEDQSAVVDRIAPLRRCAVAGEGVWQPYGDTTPAAPRRCTQVAYRNLMWHPRNRARSGGPHRPGEGCAAPHPRLARSLAMDSWKGGNKSQTT